MNNIPFLVSRFSFLVSGYRARFLTRNEKRETSKFCLARLLVTFLAAAAILPAAPPKLVLAIVIDQFRYDYLLRIFFPDLAPRGFTTLFVFFLFLGGIQLLCLSIIGSYLAHIYDEVKRRPPYIVESILNPPKENRAE